MLRRQGCIWGLRPGRSLDSCPALIALLSVAGLASALIGDGAWDAISWLMLLVPIAVYGGYIFVARSKPERNPLRNRSRYQRVDAGLDFVSMSAVESGSRSGVSSASGCEASSCASILKSSRRPFRTRRANSSGAMAQPGFGGGVAVFPFNNRLNRPPIALRKTFIFSDP